jgi:TPR repeat protein
MFERWLSGVVERRDERPAYESALDCGDFAVAVPLLQVAVTAGDPQARAIYGTMLLLGHGIAQDTADGMAWIRQAALGGNLSGMMLLGGGLAAGLHVQRNDEEACFWLWKAASAGLIEAADALSDVVLRSPGVVGIHFSGDDFDALMCVMKPARRGH